MASEKERALLLSLRKEADLFYKDVTKVLTVFGNFPDMGRDECLLISRQNPSATLLMKHAEWAGYGRTVRLNTEPVIVFEPYVYKEDIDTGQKDLNGKAIYRTETVYSFRTAAFYDISDTEGEELPQELFNNASYMEYDTLEEALIKLSPYKITEGDRTFCDTDEKIIYTDGTLDNPEYIKNLVYNIAYAATYEKSPDADNEMLNITAKCTAFSVLTRFNVDTSDISFTEVPGWADKKEKNILFNTLSDIKKISGRIITDTEKIRQNEMEELNSRAELEEKITDKAKDVLANNNIHEKVISTDIYSVTDDKKAFHMLVVDREENPGYEADFILSGKSKEYIKSVLNNGRNYEYLNEYLEQHGIKVRVDVPHEGYGYDLKFCLKTMSLTDYREYNSVSAVTAIEESTNEEQVFETLSESRLTINDTKVNINTMSMEKQPDMYTYTERIEKYEADNIDSRWPMVIVAYTNVEGEMPLSFNLNQSVKYMQRLAEKTGGDRTKYAKLKIAYTYNDWRYEHVQDVDIAEGSINYLDYLRLPDKVIRHLKSHNSVMEMEEVARNFAPDTTYGNEYSDRVEDWAYLCRMELNHNSEAPVIPKPPEIDNNYIVKNNDWRMEI